MSANEIINNKCAHRGPIYNSYKTQILNSVHVLCLKLRILSLNYKLY